VYLCLATSFPSWLVKQPEKQSEKQSEKSEKEKQKSERRPDSKDRERRRPDSKDRERRRGDDRDRGRERDRDREREWDRSRDKKKKKSSKKHHGRHDRNDSSDRSRSRSRSASRSPPRHRRHRSREARQPAKVEVPSTFYYDRKGDEHNTAYQSLYAMDIPKYRRFGSGNCIGLPKNFVIDVTIKEPSTLAKVSTRYMMNKQFWKDLDRETVLFSSLPKKDPAFSKASYIQLESDDSETESRFVNLFASEESSTDSGLISTQFFTSLFWS